VLAFEKKSFAVSCGELKGKTENFVCEVDGLNLAPFQCGGGAN
jgi:hypothetical protein